MDKNENFIVEATKFQVAPKGYQKKESFSQFFDRLAIRGIDPENCMIVAGSAVKVMDETFGSFVSTKNWNLGTENTSSIRELCYQNSIHQADGTRLVRLVFMMFEALWNYIPSAGRPPSQIVMFRTMYGPKDMTESFCTEVEGLRCALEHIYEHMGAPLPRVELLYVDEIEGLQGKMKIFRLEQPIILPNAVPMMNDETGYSNGKFKFLAEMEAKELPSIALESYASCLECVFKTC